jgi:hypothetical protein
MPYLSIIDGVPTMVDDATPTPVAPSVEPIIYARPDDMIVLRPNKPPKVIKAEELELEVREITPDDYSSAGTRSESESEDEEPQYGTWQPDTSCFIPENKPEPEPEPKPARPLDLDLWRIGLRNDDAEIVIKFHNERLEKCDDTIKTTAGEIGVIFNEWKDDKDDDGKPRNILDPNMNYNRILWDFLSSRYGGKKKSKTVFWGVRLNLTDEERERKDAMERAKREKEELIARDLAERLTAQEQFAQPPDTSSEEEPVKKKLKDIIDWNGKIIHRHPEYPRYGGDLTTGEIIKLKGNKIDRLVSCDLKKGVVLSNGKDEDGNRIQKYKSAQLFIAECGKLKGATKFHTKLKINKEYPRPFVRFYPLACLSYEYDGGLDFDGDTNHIKTGNALVSRCKTTKEINDYIEGVKDAFEEKRRNDKTEIAKLKGENTLLKSRVSHLETQVAKLNTPLSAGAIQLQELLMTEHQGSTVLEMLSFCFKDITRNYPKATDDDYERDDANADFGLFEMSPRGLFNRNEIVARQDD